MNDPAATDAGPGFLAFVAFFLLALVLWFLMRNMNARMRRMSYRQQAAHRGNDEPQATESDLDEAESPVPTEPESPVPTEGGDGEPEAGENSVNGESSPTDDRP